MGALTRRTDDGIDAMLDPLPVVRPARPDRVHLRRRRDAARPARPMRREAAGSTYVYLRDNPCGPHDELWYHGAGCRSWFKVRATRARTTIVASALRCGSGA